MLNSLLKIGSLVEWPQLDPVFDVVAPLLADYTPARLNDFCKSAHQLNLPFPKVWQAIMNNVLLMHQEMTDSELVPICYYLCKNTAHKDLIVFDSGQQLSQKLIKKVQITFLQDHLQAVEATGDNVLMLTYLMDYFSIDKPVPYDVVMTRYASMDGLSSMTEFTYDMLLDLVNALPEGADPEIWSIIVLLMAQHTNKKGFYTLN